MGNVSFKSLLWAKIYFLVSVSSGPSFDGHGLRTSNNRISDDGAVGAALTEPIQY
jgi:hypothetical protein